MSIQIVVSNTVTFKVKGSINDEKGVAQPFHFGLTCVRLDADQIKDKLSAESEGTTTEFLSDVIEAWDGVRDADGKPLPYTADNLRQLCKIPGVAALTFRTYLIEVGAKEKN